MVRSFAKKPTFEECSTCLARLKCRVSNAVFQDSAPEGGESEYESADDDIVPGLEGVKKEKKERKVERTDDGETGGGEEPYPGIDREEGDGEEDPTPHIEGVRALRHCS